MRRAENRTQTTTSPAPLLPAPTLSRAMMMPGMIGAAVLYARTKQERSDRKPSEERGQKNWSYMVRRSERDGSLPCSTANIICRWACSSRRRSQHEMLSSWVRMQGCGHRDIAYKALSVAFGRHVPAFVVARPWARSVPFIISASHQERTPDAHLDTGYVCLAKRQTRHVPLFVHGAMVYRKAGI